MPKRTPPSHTPNTPIFLPLRAQVTELTLSDETLKGAVNAAITRVAPAGETVGRALATMAGPEALREVITNATSPVGANQQPRILQVSAFIAHADQINGNDFNFRGEVLKTAVEKGLFQAPFLGMIDFNHDFVPYGAWYKAEYAYDPVAKAYGILAHGAVWAWRFPELADKVLAEQSRQGYVDVSIGILFSQYEVLRNAEGRTYLDVADPVFLTTSLLDVEGADVHARGVGTENVDSSESDRARALLQAMLAALKTPDAGTMGGAPATSASLEEGQGMEKMLQELQAALGEQKELLAPLVTELQKFTKDNASAVADLQAQVAELTRANEALTGQVAELATAKEAAEGQVAEANLAKDTALTSLNDLTAEIEPLRAFKADADLKAAEAAQEALKTARLAALPEPVRAEFAKQSEEDQARLVESWLKLDETEWGMKLNSLSAFVPTKPSRADVSATEGMLVTAADAGKNGNLGTLSIPLKRR